MDLAQTIRKLRKERQKLDEMIAGLQHLREREAAKAAQPAQPKKRRGRKFMADGERKEVSARMKAYWAKWRESGQKREGNPK